MKKLYERQIFEENTAPDLSAANMNLITKAIDQIDDRVCDILPADDYLELAQQTKEAAEEAKEAAERAHTTEVIVSPLVTEGTHIADISVNGRKAELYAPTGGGGVSASINGIPLVGDKTDAELGLASAEQLTASDNLKFRFATDGEGNYGYLGADDSFIPFKAGGDAIFIPVTVPYSGSGTTLRTIDLYSNDTNEDITFYFSGLAARSGGYTANYFRIMYDSVVLFNPTSAGITFDGSFVLPKGKKVYISCMTSAYVACSISSLPFEGNVPIEDLVPIRKSQIQLLPNTRLSDGIRIVDGSSFVVINNYPIDCRKLKSIKIKAKRSSSSTTGGGGYMYIVISEKDRYTTWQEVRDASATFGDGGTKTLTTTMQDFVVDLTEESLPEEGYVYIAASTSGTGVYPYWSQIDLCE